MKYFVTINHRVTEVEVDGGRIVVDGDEVHATLTRVPGTPEVRLRIDGSSAVAAVDHFAGGTWRVVDQGLVVDAEVVDERTRHIRSLAGTAKAGSGGGVLTLKAPMPGLVVRIAVAEGDAVTAGQGLVVLEAMKMENELKAPAAGVVRKISATVGSAVEKGQVLLEIDPAAAS